MPLPTKAKITALVCSGLNLPKAEILEKIKLGENELQGNDKPDQHAYQAPDETGEGEVADYPVIITKLFYFHIHGLFLGEEDDG